MLHEERRTHGKFLLGNVIRHAKQGIPKGSVHLHPVVLGATYDNTPGAVHVGYSPQDNPGTGNLLFARRTGKEYRVVPRHHENRAW